MTIKTLLIAGIAITSAISASAQDIVAPASTGAPASHSKGIRIAKASNGFRLVEHGLWSSTQDRPASGLIVRKNGPVNLPYRYETKAKRGPSGFRRASYLPHIYAAEPKYSCPAGLGQLMPATAKEQRSTTSPGWYAPDCIRTWFFLLPVDVLQFRPGH